MAEEPPPLSHWHFPKVFRWSRTLCYRLVRADEHKCHEPTEVHPSLQLAMSWCKSWSMGLWGPIWVAEKKNNHRLSLCDATLMLATYRRKAILPLHSPVLDLDNLRSNAWFSKMLLWKKPRCFVDFVWVGKLLPTWCFSSPGLCLLSSQLSLSPGSAIWSLYLSLPHQHWWSTAWHDICETFIFF